MQAAGLHLSVGYVILLLHGESCTQVRAYGCSQPTQCTSLSEAGCRPENWKDKLPPLGGSS